MSLLLKKAPIILNKFYNYKKIKNINKKIINFRTNRRFGKSVAGSNLRRGCSAQDTNQLAFVILQRWTHWQSIWAHLNIGRQTRRPISSHISIISQGPLHDERKNYYTQMNQDDAGVQSQGLTPSSESSRSTIPELK